ncbi:nucleotide pyrophosphohydrolase [Candidatus Falkowbacteria bacterium]|nr:nucleotide pyrophosphohydrolase [Candidatus Falkowbacteria bacterium]
MSELTRLTEKIIKFRNDREWGQFHNPKDLAISLSLEASEVLEHFQWKNEIEALEYIKKNKEEIGDELGDVLNYILIMANDFGIDLIKAADKKIDKNMVKYPVEKARGVATKYNKL